MQAKAVAGRREGIASSRRRRNTTSAWRSRNRTKGPSAIGQVTSVWDARDEAKATVDQSQGRPGERPAQFRLVQGHDADQRPGHTPSGRVGNLVSQNVTVLTNVVSLKPIWAYIDVDQNTAQQVQALIKEGKIKRPATGRRPGENGRGCRPTMELSDPTASSITSAMNSIPTPAPSGCGPSSRTRMKPWWPACSPHPGADRAPRIRRCW